MRKEDFSFIEVLDDIFKTSLVLSHHRKLDEGLFGELQQGISSLQSHVIGSYDRDDAMISSSKAAYLSRVLGSENAGIGIEKFDEDTDLSDWVIDRQRFNRLNKVKKVSGEGFYYWYKALEVGPIEFS